VDQLETQADLTALRRSVARGAPFGAESCQRQTAKRLGLESSLRPVGRPSKAEKVP
jgi:putative transposase